MSAIDVILNGDRACADQAATLAEQLESWGYDGGFPFAVAVDGALVVAEDYSSTHLTVGSQIDVIALREGG